MSSVEGPTLSAESDTGDGGASDELVVNSIQNGDTISIKWTIAGSDEVSARSGIQGSTGEFNSDAQGNTLTQSDPSATQPYVAGTNLSSASFILQVATNEPPPGNMNQSASYTATCVRPAQIRSISLTPNPFRAGQAVTVEVTDTKFNTNSASAQSINGIVTNKTTGEQEEFVLIETGGNTGVFTFSLPTTAGTTGSTNDGTMTVKAGDELEATTLVTGVATPTAAATASLGIDGVISTPATFNVGTALTVQVNDADLNLDPLDSETLTVVVSNETGETEDVTLTEQSPNAGIFSGALPTVLGDRGADRDGAMNVRSGHVLTVEYFDALAASGNPTTRKVTSTGTSSTAMTANLTVDNANISAPDLLTYTISVANSGGATLTNPTMASTLTQGATALTLTSGPTLSSGDDDDGVFEAGETWVYKATYQTTQNEIDNDSGAEIRFTVVVGTDAGAQEGWVDTSITRNPAAKITMDVSQKSLAAPDLLVYAIVVENTGNTMLHSAELASNLAQTGGVSQSLTPTYVSGDLDGDGSFDKGETWGYSASYSVTQADVTNGADIVNTATFSSFETSVQSAMATTTIASTPAFTISNEVNPKTVSAPGTLTYAIKVKNTGSVELTSAGLNDQLAQGGSALTIANPTLSGDVDGDFIFDVGETWTYSATYDVTPANIDNGGDIVNTATFQTAETAAQSATSTTTINIAGADVTIAMEVNEATFDKVGDVLHYTITVANTGSVALTSIALTDDLTSDEACPADMLAARAEMVCTASYTVTQSDLDKGSVLNSVTVSTSESPSRSDDATSNAEQVTTLHVGEASFPTFSWRHAGHELPHRQYREHDADQCLADCPAGQPHAELHGDGTAAGRQKDLLGPVCGDPGRCRCAPGRCHGDCQWSRAAGRGDGWLFGHHRAQHRSDQC